jgi:hypothetical protein
MEGRGAKVQAKPTSAAAISQRMPPAGSGIVAQPAGEKARRGSRPADRGAAANDPQAAPGNVRAVGVASSLSGKLTHAQRAYPEGRATPHCSRGDTVIFSAEKRSLERAPENPSREELDCRGKSILSPRRIRRA